MIEIEGVIAAFDERRGDGVFRDARGESLYFHCVNIGNGSRTIKVGVRARARRAVGHLGSDEATDVVSLSPEGAAARPPRSDAPPRGTSN